MNKKRLSNSQIVLVCSASCLLSPIDAHAYLDPGTGSILFSAILGILSTVYFIGKSVVLKASYYFSRLTGRKMPQAIGVDIVFYSEGQQYWTTFKPLIDGLMKASVPIIYWTSDQNDPGLVYQAQGYSSNYIGKGNKAFARLNMMEAKVCVTTTPGIDVLQIKRSKGVDQYVHVVHAPTTGTYKLYSFDYFDVVMCSGQHQIDAIRELEAKRGSPAKQLLETGCVYMDVLSQQLEERVATLNVNNDSKQATTTILVAPSWGENGLLKRFGSKLFKTLLEQDYQVVLRPHPQSYVVEADLLESIRADLESYPNLEWDTEPSGFNALASADIMISDFSGIVFDCALVFQKPVITVDFSVNLNGLDANDLDQGLWELNQLDSLGKQINDADIDRLPEIISALLNQAQSANGLSEVRDNSLFNFAKAGEVGTKQLIDLIQ